MLFLQFTSYKYDISSPPDYARLPGASSSRFTGLHEGCVTCLLTVHCDLPSVYVFITYCGLVNSYRFRILLKLTDLRRIHRYTE